MRYHNWAFILPLIVVLMWSVNVVVTRYVVDYISPISISFYRWFIAFLILTPFKAITIWERRLEIKYYIGKLSILSILGMGLSQGLAYLASHYTTATNMGIINAFIPIFTIFISYFFLNETPNRFGILGSILSVFGLFYVVGQGHSYHFLIQRDNSRGDLLMIMAVIFYALYCVLLKKWHIKLPLMTSLYIQITLATIFHIPFIMWFGLDHLNSNNVASVLYASIFISLIGPLLWMAAVQKIGPNKTSVFINFMPIFTAVIASFWLSEHWTFYHSLGGVMILIGTLIAQKKLNSTKAVNA